MNVDDFLAIKESERAFDTLLRREMDRATADIVWQMNDQINNADIGPQHHPDRNDLRDARRNLRRQEIHDGWRRCAGEYRRVRR